jgi:hypothetical protein
MFSILTGYEVDDAMITFRYAENLAGGLGFVYNAGERVLGTTSPLWTLILAVAGVLHADVPAAALFISVIVSGFTAVIVYRLARTLGAGPWSAIAGLIYALHPRSVTVDICGLEEAVFAFMLMSAIYRLRQGKSGEALLWSAGATLTRPEGALILLGVMAIVIVQRRRIAIAEWIVATSLILGWVGFAAVYFGSPIPNSVAAKIGLYSAETASILQRTSEMMLLTNPIGWFLWLGAVLAAVFSTRRRAIVLPSSAIALVYSLGIAWGSPKIFFWYPAPLIPLLAVLAAVGVNTLSNRLIDESRKRLTEGLATASAVAAAIGLVFILSTRIPELKTEMAWYDSTHVAAGAYLSALAGPGATVLAEDIGHFGYNYRGAIVDRDGLVTPAAIEFNRQQRFGDFVDSVGAEWIFLAVSYRSSQEVMADPRFSIRYAPVEFNTESRLSTHRLYRRLTTKSAP